MIILYFITLSFSFSMLFNSMDIVNDDQFGTDHVIDFVLMSGNVRITL